MPYRDFVREYEEFNQGERINAKMLRSSMETKGYEYRIRMVKNVNTRGYDGIRLKITQTALDLAPLAWTTTHLHWAWDAFPSGTADVGVQR